MNDEIEPAMVRVRADTRGFEADVKAMRAELEGSLGTGAERAGRAIEGALLKAVRTGKLGFDDLRGVAVKALGAIAAEAVRGGLVSLLGGEKRGASALGSLIGGVLGLPGRATGGPVAPGRAYAVGERGPELFVPTAAGRVEAPAAAAGPRDVRVAITVNAKGGEDARVLAQSSRQVARAVRAALEAE